MKFQTRVVSFVFVKSTSHKYHSSNKHLNSRTIKILTLVIKFKKRKMVTMITILIITAHEMRENIIKIYIKEKERRKWIAI